MNTSIGQNALIYGTKETGIPKIYPEKQQQSPSVDETIRSILKNLEAPIAKTIDDYVHESLPRKIKIDYHLPATMTFSLNQNVIDALNSQTSLLNSELTRRRELHRSSAIFNVISGVIFFAWWVVSDLERMEMLAVIGGAFLAYGLYGLLSVGRKTPPIMVSPASNGTLEETNASTGT
jgi:hypothetical protein